MSNNNIVIRGARAHNLKNIDLELPRDSLIVMTGLSGSGKSSLAFDTIFADGQRRYMESLSSYARMFLGQMEKPDVDSIEGLSPAISIDQKTTSKNPRSTVGTVTEIYDYFRLLYARIGIPHCPFCNKEIRQQSVDQIVDKIAELPEGSKIQLLAPIVRGRKGEHVKEIDKARKDGYVRARIDGDIYDLNDDIQLEKNKKHSIEIVVDRLVIRHIEGKIEPTLASRLADSVELCGSISNGLIICDVIGGEEVMYSQQYACPDHGVSVEELTPRMFSFNNPFGACEKCTGLGVFNRVDPDLILPNFDLSLNQGAVKAAGWATTSETSVAKMYFKAICKHYGASMDAPLKELPKEVIDAILYGTGDLKLTLHRPKEWGGGVTHGAFEGIVHNLERRYTMPTADWSRGDVEASMTEEDCPECHGTRLKKEVLGVTIGGKNIYELTSLSVVDCLAFIDGLELTEREKIIGERLLKEIKDRLTFLKNVGLEYLTLSRSASTLSGGESQRIRLATQIGSQLMGVLYILDEPSIGLHQRDNDKLIATLKRLRDLGNTLIVVEHDEDTMRAADYIVDIGPKAGVNGGRIVCAGSLKDIVDCKESITGAYLSGRLKVPVPEKRREGNGTYLVVKGAKENNLKNIDIFFPLSTFVCVTGVSGSGKSSLVNQIIYKHLASKLNKAKTRAGKFDEMLIQDKNTDAFVTIGEDTTEYLDKVIAIDQSPIGRTPRSNPATYTGVFGDIRELFATTNDAKMKGYTAGRFSFNVKGGRCESCEGDGIIKIEMHFLPDVYVPCEVCKGKRYNRETLEIKYKDKSIHDVLEMTVDEGVEFFENHPKIKRKLQTLKEVGLGYIKIGQPATTLSGGEAQRVKLATELSKRPTGKTIYILDEPTTGLHTADVHKLLEVLSKLVDTGNTVLIIEHNLDVIKTADYIVDLGREGGDKGGTLIVSGTPEEIAKCKDSYTGEYLKKVL